MNRLSGEAEKSLPLGVVPRAANRNEHDCRWQSYLYYGGTPSGRTDEGRKAVTAWHNLLPPSDGGSVPK